MILWILLSLFIVVQSRVYETSMLFNHFGRKQGWLYLDKMTFEPGTAQFTIQTRTQGLSMGGLRPGKGLIFQPITQTRWQQQQRLKCLNPIKQPYFHQISPPTTEKRSQYIDKTSFKITIYKQQTFYFVIKDCQKVYKSQYDNPNMFIFIKLSVTNNGRQIGAQQDHWYIIPIILASGMWLIFVNKDGMKVRGGQTDWAKIFLFTGIATNISSLTWKTFGYIIYRLTGSDYIFFHFIYLFMHSVSECLVIGLILVIGFGWSLNYLSIRQFDIYLPIFGMVGCINVICTVLSKLNSKQHDRHHIFDSIPGLILSIYRGIILLTFIGAIIWTYNKSRFKIKKFIIKFGILGFLYISALPTIILIAGFLVEPMNRNQFVFVTVELVKTTCNILLTYMISSKKSEYQSVAYKNASFIPEEEKFY